MRPGYLPTGNPLIPGKLAQDGEKPNLGCRLEHLRFAANRRNPGIGWQPALAGCWGLEHVFNYPYCGDQRPVVTGVRTGN